jgi:hypothetical protein
VPSLIASFFATGYDPLLAVSLAPSDLAPMAASFAVEAAAGQSSSRAAKADLARAERLMANQIWHLEESR